MSSHHTETVIMEKYLFHQPIYNASKWIEAVREITSGNDALGWMIDMRMRGVPLDPSRSPHDNLMSFNLMHVRDLPCTPR